MRRLTTEEFIRRAKIIHGGKYKYCNVDYKNARKKVPLHCAVHGEFLLTPEHHLRGVGCPKCAGRYKTKEEFIYAAQQVHHNKYDYSALSTITAKEKLKIICPTHGTFYQSSYAHLNGSGCPRCIGRHKSTSDFILSALEVHGGKYSYENTIYTKANEKVRIDCPMHGAFTQLPYSHAVMGQGCPVCSQIIVSNSSKLTNKEFIARARTLHGNKYSYSHVKYSTAKEKVKIYCRNHNSYFMQTPDSHLRGQGCPICGVEKNKGKNHHWYKDGRGKARNAERNSPENRMWVKEIKKNKDYCDCCGAYFSDLFIPHAHHLNSWVDNPEQRYDLSNGVCICNYCHEDFHSYYGAGFNIVKQYTQYKEMKGVLHV